MGLYIKGMETPKKCSGCVMRVDNPDIGMRCRITGNDIDTLTFWHGSLSDCPLVEVKTPHGRLIDENNILNSFAAKITPVVVRVAKESPTVIEAEGKE